MNNDPLQNFCPYCLNSNSKQSKDHIFSQFLGGSKTIVCCKKCNEKFGQSFEAVASKTLQSLHLFISSWGVPLGSANPIWKKAFEYNDETYNLTLNEKGVVCERSKPLLEFYDDGRIKKGKYRSREEAEKTVQNLHDKGKANKNISIIEVPSEIITFSLTPAVELGPEIRRLALKMCIGLSTFSPNFNMEEVNEARLYLNGDPRYVPVNNVLICFDSYNEIDSNREPLAHVIYIEKTKSKVYGLVQFFGVIQFFCHLGNSHNESNDFALMATLNPVSGEETFFETTLVGIRTPPYFYSQEEFIKSSENWTMKLGEEAKYYGANPTELKLSKIDFHNSLLK